MGIGTVLLNRELPKVSSQMLVLGTENTVQMQVVIFAIIYYTASGLVFPVDKHLNDRTWCTIVILLVDGGLSQQWHSKPP